MGVTVSRELPSPRVVDGGNSNDLNRGSGYGEPYVLPVVPSRPLLADEGSYFIGRTPTPGTGVAGHAAPTTMDNTKPFVLIQNGAPSGGKRLYLDYLRLVVTAAGTAGTLNYATHLLDPGAGYTSGGSAITVVSPSGPYQASRSIIANSYVGAAVATASARQRTVSHQRVRTVIPVVGDTVIFEYGGEIRGSGMPLEGTTELERVIHCPPVVLAPGDWYKLVLWRASQSAAASYELEMGWFER